MDRVGKRGDGGKWVCDPWRLAVSEAPCLVYSFGSRNDFSFENSLLEILPDCEVHTFDHTSNPPRPSDNSCIVFHKLGLASDAATSTDDLHTLGQIMTELNHTGRHIAVLKVDIESAEYPVFKSLLSSNEELLLRVRQILLEIHFNKKSRAPAINEMMDGLHALGFAIFSKEPNLLTKGKCVEYSFVRLSKSFFRS